MKVKSYLYKTGLDIKFIMKQIVGFKILKQAMELKSISLSPGCHQTR